MSERTIRLPQTKALLAVGYLLLASLHTAAWADYPAIMVQWNASTNTITTTPSLYKSAQQTPANLVTTIDDLPLGIRHSAWAQDTGNRGNLYVILGAGRYKLNRSWTWTHLESGRVDSHLYIRSEVPGQAIIEGSKTLTVPHSEHNGVGYYARLLDSPQPFEQLWVNERRAVRARMPNAGSFFYVKDPVTAWGTDTTPEDQPADHQAFVSEPAVLAKLSDSELNVTQRADLVVVVANGWSTGHHRLKYRNEARNELFISPTALRPFLSHSFGAAQRYFIENIPTALDAEREWFRGRDNRLNYKPSTQERQGNLRFDMPRTDIPTLMTVQGEGAPAAYIYFQGLAFRYASATLPAEGFLDRQAAVLSEIPSAIQVDNAHHIVFSNCEISRVGGYALWLRNNVTDSQVIGCAIYDTGAGGIKIGQDPKPGVMGFTGTQRNYVQQNKIYSIGHQFPGGVGVWVGKSPSNLIEDNLIKDTMYSGISVGWTWKESDTDAGVSQPAQRNTIRRNFLVDVMQGLSDGAGIYTLGGTSGTQIYGNVIKNAWGFSSYGAGAYGIYNDEGSNNILASSNTVFNTRNGGYNFHLARLISLEGNAFGPSWLGEMTVIPLGGAISSRAVGNYFFPKVEKFIRYSSNNEAEKFTYSDGGFAPNKVSTQGYNFTDAQLPSLECLKSTVDCVRDATLSIDSGSALQPPVIKSNNVPIVFPHQPPSFSGATFADVPSPSAIWKVADPLVERRRIALDVNDASNYPIGSTPAYLKIVGRLARETPKDNEKHRDLVSIAQVSPTERCLKFYDRPIMTYAAAEAANDTYALANSSMPFAVAMTNYDTGTSTVKFRLKADAATRFIHEWRDTDANWFNFGPSMSFVSGPGGVVVKAKSEVMATVPLNQWFEVEVTSTQGNDASWQARVRYAPEGIDKLSATYMVGHPNWTTRALYFISDATHEDGSTCLDRLEAFNTP